MLVMVVHYYPAQLATRVNYYGSVNAGQTAGRLHHDHCIMGIGHSELATNTEVRIFALFYSVADPIQGLSSTFSLILILMGVSSDEAFLGASG